MKDKLIPDAVKRMLELMTPDGLDVDCVLLAHIATRLQLVAKEHNMNFPPDIPFFTNRDATEYQDALFAFAQLLQDSIREPDKLKSIQEKLKAAIVSLYANRSQWRDPNLEATFMFCFQEKELFRIFVTSDQVKAVAVYFRQLKFPYAIGFESYASFDEVALEFVRRGHRLADLPPRMRHEQVNLAFFDGKEYSLRFAQIDRKQKTIQDWSPPQTELGGKLGLSTAELKQMNPTLADLNEELTDLSANRTNNDDT